MHCAVWADRAPWYQSGLLQAINAVVNVSVMIINRWFVLMIFVPQRRLCG